MIGMIRLRSLRHLFLFKVVSSCPTFTLNIIISSTMSPESGSWQIFFTMPTEKSTLLPQTWRHFVRVGHTRKSMLSLLGTWRNWVWASTLPNHFLFCMRESQSRLSGAFRRAALAGRWKVDCAHVSFHRESFGVLFFKRTVWSTFENQTTCFILKMTDRCVILLEKVLDDNARLRETLETRDAQHRRQLEELSLKITQTAESSTCPSDRTKSSRKRGRKVSVPRQCRVSIV